jgi:hypothetical protein
MYRTLLTLLLWSSTTLLGTASRAEDRPAKPKAADSPEQAVALLAEAAKTGDADAFLAQLGAHARASFEMGRAIDAYQAALDAKFGKAAGRDTGHFVREELDQFKASSHRVRGRADRGDSRVDLTVWVITRDGDRKEHVQEETWTSLKEAAGWKIVFPGKGVAKKATRKDADGHELEVTVITAKGYDPTTSAEEEKAARAAVGLLDQLTKDVKSGKYTTREKAEEALDEAKKQLRGKGK